MSPKILALRISRALETHIKHPSKAIIRLYRALLHFGLSEPQVLARFTIAGYTWHVGFPFGIRLFSRTVRKFTRKVK